MKLVDYIVAALIVGLFITVIAVAMVSVSEQYGTQDVSNNLSGYSTVNETLAQIHEIDSKNITQSQGTFDIIGDYFAQGYAAFKLTRNSVSLVDEVGTKAIADSELGGDSAGTFKLYFSAIILVIFVIGILAVVLNRDV